MVSGTNNNNNGSMHIMNKNELGVIYEKRISSVGPARVTGDSKRYEPSNIDLAMKLHYLRLVYIFEGDTQDVFKMPNFKEAIFSWLSYYYESCGRFRRPPPDDRTTDGRPYIKCNDCGLRLVEAKSSKTLEEWLQLKDIDIDHRLLVPHHILEADLPFSPTVFLQITSFKCGGFSVGLSWAHILGDVFSASDFINSWGQFLKGQEPTYPPNLNKSPPKITHKSIKPSTSGPFSLKQVGPVGDHWTFSPPCDMDTFSFHVTTTQLAQLKVKMSKTDQTPSPIRHFEALSAVIWRAIAKVRDGPDPNVVTVITQGIPAPRPEDKLLRNNQVVSSVKAHFSVAEAHPEDLAMLIRDEAQDERAQIEELVGPNPGGSDFIVYGSNPTFVDWGEAGLYGFELKGLKPRLVNCFVDGIGGEGVVLVLPSHEDGHYGKIGDEGRIVTLILPKIYMEDLKEELQREWDLIV